MNPVLDDVRAAFNRVAVRPRLLKIDRKGVTLPAGGHFQGIQRISGSGRLVITSNSDSEAYFVTCDMTADGTRGRASTPVRMAASPLKHAGGCQVAGVYLAAGVEDDAGRRHSEIQFWNVGGSPVQVPSLTIRREGAQDVSTAGAVGVSSYRAGAAVCVATWNAATVDFYTAVSDPFAGRATFQFRGTWSKTRANKSGWVDGNFGEYQSLNMLTQRDGRLFLMGFNRSGSDDWMDLFSVDLDAPAPNMLTKIAKKHMYCSDGCSFLYGAGVSVASPTQVDVYAVKGDSGDHATGTTIVANLFPAS